MKLYISKKYHKEMIEDTCCLGTTMLQLKSTHLFIASYKWDEVQIELDDCIGEGMLKYLPSVCNKITATWEGQPSEKIVHQLTELYPAKAGKIRMRYLQGGDIREVINQ